MNRNIVILLRQGHVNGLYLTPSCHFALPHAQFVMAKILFRVFNFI